MPRRDAGAFLLAHWESSELARIYLDGDSSVRSFPDKFTLSGDTGTFTPNIDAANFLCES